MSESNRPRLLARRILLFGVLPFLAISAFVLPRAFARGGWGHGCRGQVRSVEQMRERMGYGAERVLDRVDATDEQRQAFDSLLDRLAPEAFAYQQEKRALAKRMQTALAADDVDAAELETIRAAGIELAERASKRLTQALGDASEVLTPAQRQDLADEWARWHD